MTCKHSANRGDRRYISISESIGRLPSIGSVGLTPAASDSRMPAGECSSNAPSRSASTDTVLMLTFVEVVQNRLRLPNVRVGLNSSDTSHDDLRSSPPI